MKRPETKTRTDRLKALLLAGAMLLHRFWPRARAAWQAQMAATIAA